MRTQKSRLLALVERKIHKVARELEDTTEELLEDLADEAADAAHAQVEAFANKLKKHVRR